MRPAGRETPQHPVGGGRCPTDPRRPAGAERLTKGPAPARPRTRRTGRSGTGSRPEPGAAPRARPPPPARLARRPASPAAWGSGGPGGRRLCAAPASLAPAEARGGGWGVGGAGSRTPGRSPAARRPLVPSSARVRPPVCPHRAPAHGGRQGWAAGLGRSRQKEPERQVRAWTTPGRAGRRRQPRPCPHPAPRVPRGGSPTPAGGPQPDLTPRAGAQGRAGGWRQEPLLRGDLQGETLRPSRAPELCAIRGGRAPFRPQLRDRVPFSPAPAGRGAPGPGCGL